MNINDKNAAAVERKIWFCCERSMKLYPAGFRDLLQERLSQATDQGLASAVYLFNWMNYGEAARLLERMDQDGKAVA